MENQDDSFDLASVPHHLNRLIFEKFTYEEQARFKLLNGYCNNLSTIYSSLKFPLELSEIFVCWKYNNNNINAYRKFHFGIRPKSGMHLGPYLDVDDYPMAKLHSSQMILHIELHDEQCKNLLDIISKNQVRCNELELRWGADCDPILLNQLIEKVHCKELHFGHHGNHYFELESVKKMPKLVMDVTSGVDDKTFLNLKCEYLQLHFCQITTNGLIQYIKEWQANQRNILFCMFYSELDINWDSLCESFGLEPGANNWTFHRNDHVILTLSVGQDELEVLVCLRSSRLSD